MIESDQSGLLSRRSCHVGMAGCGLDQARLADYKMDASFQGVSNLEILNIFWMDLKKSGNGQLSRT